MGIRISSSWRTPLQLIDSWLPAPSAVCTTRRPVAPWLKRFTKAGWLGRHTPAPDTSPRDTAHSVLEQPASVAACPAAVRAAPARIARPAKTMRGNNRLVIAGRMADVCAELERLAALEQPPALG